MLSAAIFMHNSSSKLAGGRLLSSLAPVVMQGRTLGLYPPLAPGPVTSDRGVCFLVGGSLKVLIT